MTRGLASFTQQSRRRANETAEEPDMPVNQIAQIAGTLGVNWPHLIAQTISFAIVGGLLYGFAYTPLMETLEARRQQMAQSLANTARINAQLAAIEAQRQEMLEAARAEAARLVAEARVAARQLTEQAERERRRIIEDAAHLVA
jgi:F0F1-type ATP synthase membrane subunit b/b'